MQVSKRFLALLEQQLAQFTDRPDLQELVVYLALPGENGKPNLVDRKSTRLNSSHRT